MDFLEHLLNNKVLLCVLILALASVIHFIAQYAIRGFVLRRELMKTARSVKQISSQPQAELKSKLSQIFATTRVRHAWQEFEETLHEQHEWRDDEKHTTAVRATLPAEAFFNDASAIEPWLGSEYFKHLPGILTGMGIIGTFLGLIHGLQGFAPDANSVEVQRSLGNLFDNVGLAFRFSAFAISAAIIITGVEKWLYASCSKWVRELSQALDGLFRAGVGEEYLSSLVQASHESAVQGKHLKESLVEEFKVLLTNLTERQIAATQQLSLDIGQRLQQSLQEPLDKIAAAVRSASGQELGEGVAAVSDAITKLASVTDRLAVLANRLAALEGSSVQGAQALLQSTQGLGAASQNLAGVVAQLANTSTRLESVAKASAVEAQVRGDLLRDLREVSIRTQQAAREFKALADQVRTSVSDSVEHFGSSMSQTVAQHMKEYQKQLGEAVGMLSGALQELAEYAESAKK